MIVDARGDVCPVPIVKTRKALKELPEGEGLTVYVDNEIAAQNLNKMCTETGMPCKVKKISDGHYSVAIGSGELLPREPANDGLVIISSDTMGSGDDKLGQALMKSFVFALAEAEMLPKTIVFYNGGAKLTVEGSAVLDDLRRLERAGAKIFTCGACLNFYKLTEYLQVGSITNMYSIVEMMCGAKNIIRP